MVISIRDSIKMGSSMERESILGQMDLAIKGSFMRESDRAKAVGNQLKLMEIFI
jgi:hypothetical protein